ncbi:MAG: colicin uptake protein [Planctomycetota bacterium]|nr:MAG: colicin uptake protein [Planctomycetota bacterium]
MPSVLNLPLPAIEPITLPLEAFYPDLRAKRRQELIDTAKAAVVQTEADAAKKQAAVDTAKKKLASAVPRPSGSGQDDASEPLSNGRGTAVPFLDDNFATHNKELWKVLSGDWAFEDKKLKLKTPGHFATIATLTNHPLDFKATLKYRTLEGGAIGSVGLFFDMVELKDAQAVYTALGTGNSTVQAFHRINGSEVYPGAGIVPAKVKANEDTTLEVIARGQELKIWLNGELKLTYTMPTPRHPGRFALWCHAGVAEFHSLKITPSEPSIDELRLAVRAAESEAALAVKSIDVARAEAAAIEARIAAEVAKYVARPSSAEGGQSTAASHAERTATLAKAELESLRAEQQLDIAKAATKPDDAKSQEAVKASEAKATAARAAVDAAKVNTTKEDANYTPLGPTYPATSTGRRLVLARWLTSKDNPLTARVAVNHIWKRHFGTALVPSVANFGLNGKPPTHPALLDWLAVEFMESGWSLKHLHRLMVTSAAYRRASSEVREMGSGEDRANLPLSPSPSLPRSNNQRIDPENKSYWRANIRRMEAEVVRDTLWSLTNGLDRTFSGPELEPAAADTTPRRSLYFRHTPDDQATMLELFDGPSAAECFERTDSIMPQQALSLANSPVALTQSRLIARRLSQSETSSAPVSDDDFIHAAFEALLVRTPHADELASSGIFLQRQAPLLAEPNKLTRTPTGLATSIPPSTDPRLRARENLVHVLLNHQDFVTIR